MLTKLSLLTGRRPLLAAFLLGLLSALALPPLYLVPVLLLAIPGLLALLDGAGSARRAAWLGFAFGWGHHIAGLYWISHALLTDPWRWGWLVPVAVPGIALPLAAYLALTTLIAWQARPGWPRTLALAGGWTLLEWLRGLLFTGFPWNAIGTVWAFDALPLQGAALVGVHGLTLATLLLAALPALGRRAMAGGAAALALLAGLSAWRLHGTAEPEAPGVNLLLVQGNIQQEAKWREDQRWPIFRRYLELTREGAAAAPTDRPLAVIWPETASPFLLPQDEAARRYAAQVLPPQAVLLAGSVRAEWDAQGQLRHLYNSLSAVDARAELLGTYDKAHLVPFGEYMPLRGLIPIRVVQGAVDFAAGPGPVAMAPAGLPAFSPLICYEVIFPAAVTPAERPAWLLNITNDAWFGFSTGPYQHLAAARLRAAEEGLPLARAAQTGVSAVFDAKGRQVARLGLGQGGSVLAALPGALPPTLFAQWGNVTALLLAGSVLLVALLQPLLSVWRKNPAGLSHK
ncbi:apolipoprotein N-acyltransferase [Pseudoroseomonas cervicalis]|uniref:apolipoprotein N-acyltransferase n=1 Tax=Teichococcus cervicalis TaxID=204525 RepID=UPI0022F1BF05|nr:apolipoprotein N-acyltransferase [Pseudoroseomonas cervicalis]WBV43598.1 apolipoprotein N-acyltransferase [Pseudoroseomonas cervicalis]